MPRKGNVPKREILPDPMYGSKVVTKLINNLIDSNKIKNNYYKLNKKNIFHISN